MIIEQVANSEEKQQVTRKVLEALDNWFGIPEAREQYIEESANQICLVAYEQGEAIGFLCLKETGKDTVEIAVMGVLKEYHRKGIGRQLFTMSKRIAYDKGYSFIQVKTVQMGKYKEYDRTNAFYIGVGFKELEVFPTLWDEHNPCQIYIMSLK